MYNGKPVIKFTKTVNGKTTVVSYVSDKHLDLTVQTMYSGIKRGNLAKPTGEQAPITTPEANVGTVSNDRISQDDTSVKSYSMQNSEKDSSLNKSTAENSGKNAKEQIRYTVDNRAVVVIEEDILDGVAKNNWVKTVKNTMSRKFSNGIPVAGRLIKVNRITKSEYTNSKYSKYIKSSDKIIYADKFKAANNLDEIILASTNYINEDLNHERKDNFKEFARGNVLIRVGNNDYSAKVIVGFTSSNNMVLYDIVDFSEASFKLKKENAPTAMQKAGSDRNRVFSDNRIPQNDTSVNSNSMQNSENDASNTSVEKKFDRDYSYIGLAASDFYENSRIYSYDFLTAQDDMKVITDMPTLNKVKLNGKIDKEHIVELGFKNVEKVGGVKHGDVYLLENTYTKRKLQIGQDSIMHGLGSNEIYAVRTNARLGSVIGEICMNAIPINSVDNTHNVKGTYIMMSLLKAEFNGHDEYLIAKITVEQQNGKVNGIEALDVAHAVSGRFQQNKNQNKNTEDWVSRRQPLGTKSIRAPQSSDNISISKFLQIVNNLYQEYLSDDVIRSLNTERTKVKVGKFSERALNAIDTEYMNAVKKGDTEAAEQIKSAGTVTYDDDGNIIPLSKRFDENNSDIRYSTRGDILSWNIDWDSDNSSSIKEQLKSHLNEINKTKNVADIVYNKEKPYYEVLSDI